MLPNFLSKHSNKYKKANKVSIYVSTAIIKICGTSFCAYVMVVSLNNKAQSTKLIVCIKSLPGRLPVDVSSDI